MAQVLMIAAAVATVASTITGVAANQTEGRAEAGAANFNAQVAREDAGIVDSMTQADVTRQKRENILRTGQAVAAAGASGGVTGSSLDIISDNIVQQELDILNIKHQGMLQKRGYLNTASLEDARAKNVKKAANVKSASQVLGGVSNLAGLGALSLRK